MTYRDQETQGLMEEPPSRTARRVKQSNDTHAATITLKAGIAIQRQSPAAGRPCRQRPSQVSAISTPMHNPPAAVGRSGGIAGSQRLRRV